MRLEWRGQAGLIPRGVSSPQLSQIPSINFSHGINICSGFENIRAILLVAFRNFYFFFFLSLFPVYTSLFITAFENSRTNFNQIWRMSFVCADLKYRVGGLYKFLSEILRAYRDGLTFSWLLKVSNDVCSRLQSTTFPPRYPPPNLWNISMLKYSENKSLQMWLS